MENLALAILIFVLYMSFVYPLVAEPVSEKSPPTLNDYAQAFSVEPEPVKIEESQSVATESLEQIPDPWSLPLTTEKTSRQIVRLFPTPQLKLLPPTEKRSSVNRFNQMTVKQLRSQARIWNEHNPDRQISQISKLKKQQLLQQLNTLCA